MCFDNHFDLYDKSLDKLINKLKSPFTHPFHLLGIDWAPILVPLKRRLETLVVAHFIFIWLLAPFISLWLSFYIFFRTSYWWLMVLYAIWTIYDFRTPRRGSRNWTWYKYHPLWKHFADYFPLRLIKTAELPPDRNYIIGSHPHGILSIGAFTAMITNATGFLEKFPGLKPTVLTLNGQFYFSFRRDIDTGLGAVEASKESLKYLLENPGKGRAITIVLGGSQELLDARPGAHVLHLSSRRGFCRFALQYGADLVPMYNFGENDVFNTISSPRGTALRNFQEFIKNLFGFCPPLANGRGIFNYTFGLLPHRRSITTVMGAPMRVDRVENPTREQIDKLHAEYCKELTELFEPHKSLHNIPNDEHLTIY